MPHPKRKSGKAHRKAAPKATAAPSPRRGGRAGALFEALVALEARLRARTGCPWDREQTHDSLRTYLLEETYEVLEALDSGNDEKISSELGDLLLQIVFHAQLARESGRFDISDVIEKIHSKMVRRHPHVFGTQKAKTSAQVLKNWEQLKAEERRAEQTAPPGEKRDAASLLDGVPRTLPAVLEAFQLTRRASRIGFDWDDYSGVVKKLTEEMAELVAVLQLGMMGRAEGEVGDILLSAVNVARFLRVDPEIALKKANRKFKSRFKEMERLAALSGRRLADVPRGEMESLWNTAKGKTPHAASATVPRTASGGKK